MSKTVFALAVMKLAEKGDRHVLSRSSGFQDWRSKQAPLKIHFTPHGHEFLYLGEGYYYLQSV